MLHRLIYGLEELVLCELKMTLFQPINKVRIIREVWGGAINLKDRKKEQLMGHDKRDAEEA